MPIINVWKQQKPCPCHEGKPCPCKRKKLADVLRKKPSFGQDAPMNVQAISNSLAAANS